VQRNFKYTYTFIEEIVYVADILDIPVSQIINGWSQTQTQNFYTQFLSGIRYLDIRIIFDETNNIWKLHHSFVIGNNLEVLFQQTQQYIKSYPSEVLILELSHNESQSQIQSQLLYNVINSYIGSYLWPPQNGFRPISEMVSSGKNVILTCTLSDLPSTYWPASTIINSYANSPVLSTMEQYNLDQIKSWESHGIYPNQLYKISWTLTPNEDTILEMLLPDTPKTVIELADIGNKDLENFFNNTLVPNGFKYPIFANILIIDDFLNSPIIQIVRRGQ